MTKSTNTYNHYNLYMCSLVGDWTPDHIRTSCKLMVEQNMFFQESGHYLWPKYSCTTLEFREHIMAILINILISLHWTYQHWVSCLWAHGGWTPGCVWGHVRRPGGRWAGPGWTRTGTLATHSAGTPHGSCTIHHHTDFVKGIVQWWSLVDHTHFVNVSDYCTSLTRETVQCCHKYRLTSDLLCKSRAQHF